MHGEMEYYFLKIKEKSVFVRIYDAQSKWFKRIFTNNNKTDIVKRKSLDYEGEVHGVFGSSFTDIRYFCFRIHRSEKVQT